MKKLKELFDKLVSLFSKKVKTEEIVEIVKEVVAEEAPKKAKKKYYHKRKPKAE
jgi:hypothetical protein